MSRAHSILDTPLIPHAAHLDPRSCPYSHFRRLPDLLRDSALTTSA